MDYFDDYSMYSYLHYENAVNIGWNISGGLQNASIDNRIKNGLARFLDSRVNMTRGGGILKNFSYENRNYVLGAAEIRIVAKNGIVYAVPDSIIDLVFRDAYCPPDVLIDAVLYGLTPDSEQYQSYMKRYMPEHFWGASEEYVSKSRTALSVIVSGDPAFISCYLNDNPDALTIVTEEGSILNVAIRHGLDSIARTLLDCNIPIDRYNGAELFSAIDNGMNDIAEMLIDKGIPLHNYSPQSNPLFYAIMKKDNFIAMKLAKEYKQLVCTYDTPFVNQCNILQWCIRCKNKEMLDVITTMNLY